MLRAGRLARRGRLGFTLIEVLSVVAILALVAALVIPNLGGLRARALRGEATQIASHLELARQRAIFTGVPHRLWLDLDQAEYRLEWLASDPDAPPAAEPDPGSRAPLSLAAPPAQELVYQPIPGNFGRLQIIAEPFYVEGLETPQGWIEKGESYVEFARDGSADYTEIYLEDPDGHRVALDVYPLDERVRIREDVDDL